MARETQPICPIRRDAPCMGALCAWSQHTVDEDGMWRFTCVVASICEHAAVIDRREPGATLTERT